jgi:hypothetical protein
VAWKPHIYVTWLDMTLPQVAARRNPVPSSVLMPLGIFQQVSCVPMSGPTDTYIHTYTMGQWVPLRASRPPCTG